MQHLLLLHGAIGSSTQLQALEEALKRDYHIHRFDFPGHGGKEIPSEFSIRLFALSVVDFLNENKIIKVSVFGYSMGGYVAMYLAKYHSSLIDHVITLATKFEWGETIAEKEVAMLQPEVIEQKLPSFAGILKQRHSPQDWKRVLQKTALMLTDLGRDNTLKLPDYTSILTPSLIMIGDRDKMVSLEETVAVYKQLPAGQLAVLSATPHPIEQADPGLLSMLIHRFVKTPA
jgi:pimeloyl-ACP methyl ester carboxylesterase